MIRDYELYDSSFIHIDFFLFFFLVFSSFSCWFVYMIAVTPFHAFLSNKLQKSNFSLIFHFAECTDEFVSTRSIMIMYYFRGFMYTFL